MNAVATSVLFFLTERLQDFFGLESTQHHDVKPSRPCNIRHVSASFEQIIVVSSRNAFKGDLFSQQRPFYCVAFHGAFVHRTRVD